MIHLHANSAYTLLNSTLTISDLVNINKEMGFKSVCLSDVNVMYMQEVVNFELLAKNDNGYKNLMKASTIISANKYLTIEEFIKLKEDCVLIVFNDEGVLQKALIDEDEAMLNITIKSMYAELQDEDKRCIDIFSLMIKESSQREIANELGISQTAVRWYIKRIRNKLEKFR